MRRARALCLAGLVLFVASGCMRRRPFPPPVAPDVAMPAPTPPAPGSLWRPELAANYPFVDVRARFPGDLLNLMVLRPGVKLGQLVSALNALGVTPQDLIAILEAIKTSGALEAELELM